MTPGPRTVVPWKLLFILDETGINLRKTWKCTRSTTSTTALSVLKIHEDKYFWEQSTSYFGGINKVTGEFHHIAPNVLTVCFFPSFRSFSNLSLLSFLLLPFMKDRVGDVIFTFRNTFVWFDFPLVSASHLSNLFHFLDWLNTDTLSKYCSINKIELRSSS